MKLIKIILGGIAALVLALVVGININLNTTKSGLSDMVLANAEALAQWEQFEGANSCCPDDKWDCLLLAGTEGGWSLVAYLTEHIPCSI